MSSLSQAGRWLFLAGIAICVIAGLGFSHAMVPVALAVLGLIVGFLNVDAKEAQRFLVSGIALGVSATAISSIPQLGGILAPIMNNIVAFVGAAMLVVALTSLFGAASD